MADAGQEAAASFCSWYNRWERAVSSRSGSVFSSGTQFQLPGILGSSSFWMSLGKAKGRDSSLEKSRGEGVKTGQNRPPSVQVQDFLVEIQWPEFLIFKRFKEMVNGEMQEGSNCLKMACLKDLEKNALNQWFSSCQGHITAKSSEKLLSYKRCQNYVALFITALEKEETEKTRWKIHKSGFAVI
ncbi:hypothetical protein NC652_039075 [Populus alba x Populus x berolinensis]|nr:hypothetical protein NC652_039075 [Populus alba x Populus x berolinensis]